MANAPVIVIITESKESAHNVPLALDTYQNQAAVSHVSPIKISLTKRVFAKKIISKLMVFALHAHQVLHTTINLHRVLVLVAPIAQVVHHPILHA